MSSEEFLLEVGCEEIPARYLMVLSQELLERVTGLLEESRVSFESHGKAFFTPRRLVVLVEGVSKKQNDQQQTIVGPPKRVAFDNSGNPTQAARSFAERNSVRLEDLRIEITPKGEYVAYDRLSHGQPTSQILSEALLGLILGLSLPRSMYWEGQQGPRFIRPIRWICAVLHGRPVHFSLGSIKSGAWTFGHRLLKSKKILVRDFDQYEAALRQAGVILKPEDRHQKLVHEMNVLVTKSKAKLLEDQDLMDTHLCLSEHPTVISGRFDESFLALPQEILVTVMKDHQKYLSLLDASGQKLLPQFLAVIDNKSDRKGYIRRSHERVLRARFADADFFWESDLRTPMEDRAHLLEKVVFQERLGTYADKALRIEKIAEKIIADGEIAVAPELMRKGARLCKCDLTTQMVKEFPELQGVVGGLYIAAQKGNKEVAKAIYEHYRPETIEAAVPESLLGAALSLADKLDTLAGSFKAGHRPSGSKDPFGLRRLVHGILKVILEFQIHLDLRDLVEFSLTLYQNNQRASSEEATSALLEFMRGASSFVFETLYGSGQEAMGREEISAVVSTGTWDFAEMRLKILALCRIRHRENFDSLAASFKRIKNIIQKSEGVPAEEGRSVQVDLFQQSEETQLYQSIEELKRQIEGYGPKKSYEAILDRIASMRPVVDQFFDRVLVNAEEPEIRRNRFNLLFSLHDEFMQIADFSELLAVPPEESKVN